MEDRAVSYQNDGTWGVEGWGVPPDIEVVDDPAVMQNGEDPQGPLADDLSWPAPLSGAR